MKDLDKIIWEFLATIFFFFISVGIMVGAYICQDTMLFVVCGIIVIALWLIYDRESKYD